MCSKFTWRFGFNARKISRSRFLIRYALAATVSIALLGAAPAGAAEVLPGPVPAQVVKVVDGDTLRVRARIWLGQDVAVLIRLAGIDAPELRGACAAESDLAVEARHFLEEMIGDRAVTLRQIQYGKYAGRVLANVGNASGEELGEALLAQGLARPYSGGQRFSWCE